MQQSLKCPQEKNLANCMRPSKPKAYDDIVQELYTKAYTNESLSLAEERFIGGIIEQLRDKDGDRTHRIEDFEGCKNYSNVTEIVSPFFYYYYY